jgi:hypothetical protein
MASDPRLGVVSAGVPRNVVTTDKTSIPRKQLLYVLMSFDALMHSRRRARGLATGIMVALTMAALTGCGDSAGPSDDSFDIQFDFSNDYQGWAPGFSDYPVGKETEWAIGSSLAPLPAPLDGSRKGILLTGQNHSDDLFMYLTHEVAPLAPNAEYAVRFRVTLATNAPRNCVGIGGSPGESVVLKVGATPVAPARIVDAAGYYRANFDHGSQLNSGRNTTVVGNLATSNTNCNVARYELKEFDSGSSPVLVTTSATGRLWLVIGVDSGFEGTTAVYVTTARIAIDPR